ncbi:M61 family metallopeptidase [Pinibacter aurantiacus]|uniref:M61 family metallopeptidase n=1 Tax=Pinibacter aurantiacus TaxID=2851599 RepID=A0A9E2W847_9BACT|nr:hypothetical protein [Pinibacter aurantiacus]MBV4357542.1 hypothetical protein [Pinibacter aurantiacus]
MNRKLHGLVLAAFLLIFGFAGFTQQDSVVISLSLQNPQTHTVHVTLQYKATAAKTVFKMPNWTPGYYQLMHYAEQVTQFSAFDENNNPLAWEHSNANTWEVHTQPKKKVTLQYNVIADSAFVATSFIDSTHAYITPAATFLYVENQIQLPVSLNVLSYEKWSRVATGLDSIAGQQFQYTAPDFDMLYDCPILAGNLEELPSFKVGGVTHRFIGHRLADFNKQDFMNDLKKIVTASYNIMNDIPYQHYTFLGIGPGNGGIEHLTSSANSFTGAELNNENGRKSILSFLAHEYFHNYNVKRIRPIELGPFDYEHGSKTNQLWISEGWTVYYEYLLLARAGILSANDLYKNFQVNILAYEKHNGRLVQSLSQSSSETWNDGPFGNDKNKTISYYDKGPVVALLLDFEIRHQTKNTKSLDDVMRLLYQKFYKEKQRGFTEKEFWAACESIAGTSLTTIYNYVHSTEELNYQKYLAYAGLNIDAQNRSFAVTPVANPDSLQQKILASWLIGSSN